MLSDLAGDSMRLSESGSPTVNPFKLDAIICRTIFFFLNFFLHAIFKENEELRCKLTPIQTQTKPKPRTNPHPLKPNKHIKQSM